MSRLLLAVIAAAIATTPCKSETPKLFREKSFTCVTLAEAVNNYVTMGEEAALKELDSLSAERWECHVWWGARRATSVLRTGELVTVDGAKGRIYAGQRIAAYRFGFYKAEIR